MRVTAENLIAPTLLLAATCIGINGEIPAGAFGISIEHILLLSYLPIAIFRTYSNSSLHFGFVAFFFLILAVLGVVMGRLADLHLVSLILLCLMFPLYKNYFTKQKNSKLFIRIGFVLIIIQCIFFPNENLPGFDTWDYLMLPGFDRINRLSILGFVSNSLGLMLLPFCIYFLYQITIFKKERIINLIMFLFGSAIILSTFSRTAVLLLFISAILILRVRFLAVMGAIGALIVFTLPGNIPSLLMLAFWREGGLVSASRIEIWDDALSTLSISEFLTYGRGLSNPPLDNSYLSVVLGFGFWGVIALAVFFAVLALWLINSQKKMSSEAFFALTIILIVLLVSITTYDVFSQRKILFAFALVSGAFAAHGADIYTRR